MAQKNIEYLRNEKKVDVVVALTHQDFPLDRNMAMQEDVDVILGGHDHVPFIEKNRNKAGRDCWIVKVGCNCTHVSRIFCFLKLKLDEVPYSINRLA